jgi:hypothetical protein
MLNSGARTGAVRRSRHTLYLSLATVIAIAATLVPRGEAAIASTSPPSTLLPAGGAYFGSWAKPRTGETKQQSVLRAESMVGRKFAVDHQYYKWDHSFPTSYETWTSDQGRIPFMNWKPIRLNGARVTWTSIAAGAEDSWIIQRAAAVKAFARPMYLSFDAEPEDNVGVFGSAADYVNAYRRVVDLFRAQGVTNVGYVWNQMAWSFDSRSGRDPSAWYPGDAYVDLVAADGYSWYPARPGSSWNTFQSIFQPARAFALSRGKPWMIAETGVQEDPAVPGRKGDWFRGLLTTVQQWPELKAVVYFDSDNPYPWWIDSSASSIAGFREAGAGAWFNPGWPPPPPRRLLPARPPPRPLLPARPPPRPRLPARRRARRLLPARRRARLRLLTRSSTRSMGVRPEPR